MTNKKTDRDLRAHSEAIKDSKRTRMQKRHAVIWPHCIYCGALARRGEQWCTTHADVAQIEYPHLFER